MATARPRSPRPRNSCTRKASQTHRCLVTDVRMPGVSGVDLQRRLIDAGRRIPTIFMTAYPEEHMRIAAMRGGALGFLTKPVSEDRLISCIEAALGAARRLQGFKQ